MLAYGADSLALGLQRFVAGIECYESLPAGRDQDLGAFLGVRKPPRSCPELASDGYFVVVRYVQCRVGSKRDIWPGKEPQ